MAVDITPTDQDVSKAVIIHVDALTAKTPVNFET